MQIVLEGPDNGGKTTLAKYLSQSLLMPIHRSGGPPKKRGEIIQRCHEVLAINEPRLFDRHPCISQNIYAIINNGELVPNDIINLFYSKRPLLVYCRPMNGFDEELHAQSEDSQSNHEFDKLIAPHFEELLQRYDAWAIQHAHFIYRIGQPKDKLANALLEYTHE